jgi:hypothetical protein
MATGTVLPPAPPPNVQAAQPAVKNTAPQARQTLLVIERQLSRTKFHVRLVDLLSRFAILVVGVLGFMLVAALIDHWWVLPLGIWGRTVAFLLLVGGVAYYSVTQIAPLFIRRINATYAARAIEESRPSLKNSLINFLMLRGDRSGVREVVFEALERRAAEDIADVAVESAVDRAPVIRVGYVLLGVLAVCAAYKILSPKDPFQTFARVVAPWAEIAPPSRVQISDVQPGDLTVYRGRSQTISATVAGVREGVPVKLLYSTADGQTVDREVPMKPGVGGLQFSCELPTTTEKSLPDAAKPGLQQDVTYRVVASDAVTRNYRLAVVDAPMMVVEKVEYQFPAYTNKGPQTLIQGDIRALEGTKVTIHASANQPIRNAVLEFDPVAGGSGISTGSRPLESVPMQFDGQQARVTLTLLLQSDRNTAWHGSYQVRFTNAEGARSEQPVVHAIEVVRDLAPEVQILAPLKKVVEVPENGSLSMEVRAIDPDYSLSRLYLQGTSQGKTVLVEELLKDAVASPQAVAKYVFRPSEHKLVAGDEMIYVANAADNRTSPETGAAEPNQTSTAQYVVRVTAPLKSNPKEEPKPGEKPEEQPGEKPEEKQPNNPGERPEQNPLPKPGEKPMTKPGEKPMPGERPEENPQENPGEKGSKKEEDKGSNSKQGEKGSEKTGGKSEQKDGGSSGDSSEQKGGTEESAGGGGKSSQGEKPKEGTGEASQDKSSGGGTGSDQPDANSPSNSEGAERSESSQEGGASGQPSKTEHAGDAIEKILKNKEKHDKGSGGRSSSQSSNQDTGSGGEAEPKPGEGTEPTGTEPKTGDQDGTKSGNEPGEKASGIGTGEKTGNKTAANPGDKIGQKPMNTGDKSGQKTSEKPGEKAGSETKSGQGEKTAAKGRPGEKPGDKAGEPMTGAGGEKTKPGEKTQETGAKGAKGQEPAAGSPGSKPMGAANDNQTPQEKSAGGGEKGKKDAGNGRPGESGAGEGTKEKTGNADGQSGSEGKQKTQQPDGTEAKSSEASPPGQKKESDSQGGESGDKKGGGKTGGDGQSANQAGNKNPGSNSVGDNGTPGAPEKGAGSKTGDIPGNDQKSGGKEGTTGEKSKSGSEERPGEGKEPGGKPGEKPAGDPAEAQGSGEKSGSREAQGDKTGPGQVVGGGKPGTPEGPPPSPKEAADAEQANLEYARKATEMALEHLRDQKQEPDPELLKELGWTKEELAEFVRRWDAMEQAAKQDPKARKELDESLRSLGLRPAKNRKRSAPGVSDNQRDLRDSGSRSSAPPSYREQFEQFRKGAGRSE